MSGRKTRPKTPSSEGMANVSVRFTGSGAVLVCEMGDDGCELDLTPERSIQLAALLVASAMVARPHESPDATCDVFMTAMREAVESHIKKARTS